MCGYEHVYFYLLNIFLLLECKLLEKQLLKAKAKRDVSGIKRWSALKAQHGQWQQNERAVKVLIIYTLNKLVLIIKNK